MIESKLPDITEFVRAYLGVDPVKEPIPVQPMAHYAMGGLPTDIDGNGRDRRAQYAPAGPLRGGRVRLRFRAWGQSPGTNSLVDIIVFGRRGGKHVARYVREVELPGLPAEPDGPAREEIAAIRARRGHESFGTLRQELRDNMMELAGVFRTGQQLLDMIGELRQRCDALDAVDYYSYLLRNSPKSKAPPLARWREPSSKVGRSSW